MIVNDSRDNNNSRMTLIFKRKMTRCVIMCDGGKKLNDNHQSLW